jgi:hypothetical protein
MSQSFATLLILTTLTTAWLSLAPSASGSSLWNENLDGDLSNQGLEPTSLGRLQQGTNSLQATFNAGDLSPDPDYFTLTVPQGLMLKEIVLQSWTASPIFEDIAFFGVQEGKRFDFVVPPEKNSASGLLGWTHLRSAQIGNDILAEIGASNLSPEQSGFPLPAPWVPGASGFEIPLGTGDYSFWLRQGSDVNITVELDFEAVAVPVAVPESFSITGGAVALGLGWLLRKKAK